MKKEQIKKYFLYLVFGGLTTLVNWIAYAGCNKIMGFNENTSNIISWLVAVVFAFLTNRKMVFNSQTSGFVNKTKEFGKFIVSRVFTGIIEIAGLPLLLSIGLSQSIFGIEGMVAKIIVTAISIILNYIFSNYIVF